MIELEIQYDVNVIQDKLEALGIDLKNVNRKILKRITAKARSKIIAEYRRNYHSKGGITKAVYASAKNNNAGFVGILSKKAYIYKLKETGGTIKVKRKKYLTFQINNQWVKVKSVSITANPFIKPAFGRYSRSGEYKQDIDLVVQRIIDKANKK